MNFVKIGTARVDLVVQRTRTKFGERALVVAGPAAWNPEVSMLHPQLFIREQFQPQGGSENISVCN